MARVIIAANLMADATVAGTNLMAETNLIAEIAQYELTVKLREAIRAVSTRVGSYSVKEADSILERWILTMANSPGKPDQIVAWARVYRRSTMEDAFNNKLAGELVERRIVRNATQAGELVDAMLTLVDASLHGDPRLGPKVLSLEELCLEVEAHKKLCDMVSIDATTNVVLRYKTVVSTGQQWGVPQAQIDYLYDKFNVRNEGFASPLNSRLIGKPGAKFCSLFPDTDAIFGSIGSFFDQKELLGNWSINPPYIESLMADAARKVLTALDTPDSSQTFFFVIPDWTDSEVYKLLHGSPHCRAEIHLRGGTYFYEDPTGKRVPTRANSRYFALSTDVEHTPELLREALNHWRELK